MRRRQGTGHADAKIRPDPMALPTMLFSSSQARMQALVNTAKQARLFTALILQRKIRKFFQSPRRFAINRTHPPAEPAKPLGSANEIPSGTREIPSGTCETPSGTREIPNIIREVSSRIHGISSRTHAPNQTCEVSSRIRETPSRALHCSKTGARKPSAFSRTLCTVLVL